MSTRQLARLPTISNRGGRLVFSSGRLCCQKDELVSSILLRYFRLFCCTQPFPLPCYNGPAATHQATPHLALHFPNTPHQAEVSFPSRPGDPAVRLSVKESALSTDQWRRPSSPRLLTGRFGRGRTDLSRYGFLLAPQILAFPPFSNCCAALPVLLLQLPFAPRLQCSDPDIHTQTGTLPSIRRPQLVMQCALRRDQR
jgi:hypothetical protein